MLRAIPLMIVSFLLISSSAFAKVDVKIIPESKASSLPTAAIEFTGQEAKALWQYLNKIHQSLGGYVLEEGGMSKTHLSSLAIHCIETSYQVYDNIPANDPRLYNCSITLASNGLPVAPG